MLINNLDIDDLKTKTGDYRKILLSSMNLIADRYESDPDYHWIDTKLNLITGDDFSKDDTLRSKDIVYSWIQGRGLESISLHIEWIRNNCVAKNDLVLAKRLESIIREVSESIIKAKEINAGHLFFSLNPNAKALNRQDDGSWAEKTMSLQDPWNFSDIFASRGLFSGSYILNDDELQSDSAEYVKNVLTGIIERNFETDQLTLSSGNDPGAVKGRYSHAPRMIMIGSLTLLLKHNVKDAFELGVKIIRYILDNYVNINERWPDLKEFDYVEFIKSDGELWYSNGNILSDPGHTLEFVGLSIQFMLAAKSTGLLNPQEELKIENLTSAMFPIFKRSFTNGYDFEHGGIVKLLDLKSRKRINKEMPWWSLPETMRAALGCYAIITDPADRSFCMDSYYLCHNSFFEHYINNNSPGMMAIQSRNENGQVSDSIPAVPDADPGYHTGLALIDCMELINKIIGK
jgi:mannose/cellobiose epimerase-like protein (N-acyl-D-glucosamine 2-epimerase family)